MRRAIGEVAELRQQVGYWKGMFEQAKRKNEKLKKEIDSPRAENRQLKERIFHWIPGLVQTRVTETARSVAEVNMDGPPWNRYAVDHACNRCKRLDSVDLHGAA